MSTPGQGENAPNPVREAALGRLQETIADIDPTELVDGPDDILKTAVAYSRWVHTTWRDIRRFPLEQAGASMQVGFTRLSLESDKGYPLASVSSAEYRQSSGFIQTALGLIDKLPDDPETRSLIFFRHGLQVAGKLKRERDAAATDR